MELIPLCPLPSFGAVMPSPAACSAPKMFLITAVRSSCVFCPRCLLVDLPELLDRADLDLPWLRLLDLPVPFFLPGLRDWLLDWLLSLDLL